MISQIGTVRPPPEDRCPPDPFFELVAIRIRNALWLCLLRIEYWHDVDFHVSVKQGGFFNICVADWILPTTGWIGGLYG